MSKEAEEFYNNLKEKPDFTKLTSTGISSNYENVFNFTQQFADQEVKKAVLKALEEYNESHYGTYEDVEGFIEEKYK